MPSLPTKSFATVVNNIISGIQGRASKLINFAIGSTLRAIAEGYGGIFIWFQSLVLQLLAAIRLSTSVGTDVDTFTVDFMPPLPGSQTTALPTGSPRLGAQAASGQVTFTRFTAGPSSPFIPAATGIVNGVVSPAGQGQPVTVQTSDGTQTYVVIADTTNPNYSATFGGYIVPSSIGSLNVTVLAVVPGAAGNAQAGQISVITSPVTGIDTVVNGATFTNGIDVESDSALKKRFAAYILGLSRGDEFGLAASIEGVEVNVQWTLTELYNYDGSYRPGYFFVVADDGSGSPSATFLQTVTNAVNAVRPLGIQAGVFPPVIKPVLVSLNIATASGFDHNTVAAQVSATISTNINSLGLGNPLPWSIVASWAYSVPGVTSVTNVTLNGLTGDTASIIVTRLTLDGQNTIAYATVKVSAVSVF